MSSLEKKLNTCIFQLEIEGFLSPSKIMPGQQIYLKTGPISPLHLSNSASMNYVITWRYRI
jgi:hypothetical protein